MYTNYFQVTALVLIALISTHYFSHKRLSNVENRLFANFLALGGIYVALDLICGFFAEKGCGTRRQTAEVVFYSVLSLYGDTSLYVFLLCTYYHRKTEREI